MKVLFLDIDGVVNCKTTTQRHRGYIGIDPYMAFLVGRIALRTNCKVVLSSSWRNSKEGIAEVERCVVPLHGTTGNEPHDPTRPPGIENCQRGREIQRWLTANPEVTHYAILDDENDMLPEQQLHFFKTTWERGITEEIAEDVEEYLNQGSEGVKQGHSGACREA